jgi:hypothetical protein
MTAGRNGDAYVARIANGESTGTNLDRVYCVWTLIIITFLASGTSIGGVGTTTSILDFAIEAKCRAAANVLAGTDQLISTHGSHPNISRSATYRVIAYCVER